MTNFLYGAFRLLLMSMGVNMQLALWMVLSDYLIFEHLMGTHFVIFLLFTDMGVGIILMM